MSPALVIGHPTTLVVSVILIPVILAIAVFLPGNQFLPLASLAGMFYLFPLILPFTMGNVVKSLDTGTYLSSIFQQFLSPALLPALTFLIAVLISFATGTSMGTMAIMAVIALPMAYSMGNSIPLVAGAMFGGSIFGDHASPISDTTIMTCSTTGCDIIDHIKTQFPYVCSIAVISFVLYVIAGFIM